MNKALKASTVVIFSLLASVASAECTDATIQEKVAAISAEMQALAATDPERVAEISEQLSAAGANAASQEALCTVLDDMLVEIKG